MLAGLGGLGENLRPGMVGRRSCWQDWLQIGVLEWGIVMQQLVLLEMGMPGELLEMGMPEELLEMGMYGELLEMGMHGE